MRLLTQIEELNLTSNHKILTCILKAISSRFIGCSIILKKSNVTKSSSVMRIYSGSGDFVPEHFDILCFYDKTLLFAWQGKKITVFQYDDPIGASNPRLLLAPGDIKNVQSFDERIFITCTPCGVYKLSKNYQFAPLSSTAIGIGARFYQVIRVEDAYISLCDKRAKTSKLLLKHDLTDGATPHIVGLTEDNVDSELMSVLLERPIDQDELCIFSRGYEIYKITPDGVKILHSSLYLITDIVEVKKNYKVKCLLFVTNRSMVMLMYAKNEELIFEKVEFNYKVKTAHAWVDEILENVVWIIHSDGMKTHKCRKILGLHSVDITELNERNITCLRNYNSKIFGLNSTGELVQLDTKLQENPVDNGDDDFIQLKPEMLEGTDSIVETICERVKELQSFDSELLDQQNALKRINMAACKQDINLIPEMRVRKIANNTFVECKFGHDVPEKCQLSLSLKSVGRKIFSTKRVTENETNIALPVPNSAVFETLSIAIDLITLADEGYSWCINKNFIKDEGDNKIQVQLSADKINFVNSRLAALENLRMEEKIDIAKVNAIKTIIRKEFNVV